MTELSASSGQRLSAEGQRRCPVGAELQGKGASFRVWAPACSTIDILVNGGASHRLTKEADGYHSGFVGGVTAGAVYQLRLEGRDERFADPASRFQPDGPAGPSMLVDPGEFQWRDAEWKGVGAEGQVIYEMHIGTFTLEGTWKAATQHLHKLKDIGVTIIEVMPIHEFFGAFGWGYDGVLLYAPTHLYGTPDDLRAFVDSAHAIGLGVILDVVYNHFGLGEKHEHFSPDYFTDRYENDWGRSINFDGPNSAGVRTLISQNAAYWIREYHFDGLRLDATQALFDESAEHIIAEVARESRAAAGDKQIYIVGENEPQHTRLVRPAEKDGYGLTSVWNDDFHHSAIVALTGRSEAYYHDYSGNAQELITAAKYGYLFQGQRYDWQDHMRGTPGLELDAACFVHFLQNHDQVANSALGLRLNALCSPARLRAATALLLLGPQTPMLFQGQEFASSKPFLYFADFPAETALLVRKGRQQSLAQFPSLQDEAMVAELADPIARDTFARCRLDWSEFDLNRHVVSLHRDLLAMRRSEMAFASANAIGARKVDGGVLCADAFYLRFFADDSAEDRLLFVNFGADIEIKSIADPLVAPPAKGSWSLLWSSEHPSYGGAGQRPIDFHGRWTLSADSALVLKSSNQPLFPAPTKQALDLWQAEISR